MSIISKIVLVAVFSTLLIIIKGFYQSDIHIKFNNIQLNIPPEYTLITDFKEHPKYIRYEEQLMTSSFYVKNKELCLDLCDADFKGKVFTDGDSTKRLSIFHGNGYSASLWDVEFTSSEGTSVTKVGIIYNDNIMLQVMDDQDFWLSLLTQLKSNT